MSLQSSGHPRPSGPKVASQSEVLQLCAVYSYFSSVPQGPGEGPVQGSGPQGLTWPRQRRMVISGCLSADFLFFFFLSLQPSHLDFTVAPQTSQQSGGGPPPQIVAIPLSIPKRSQCLLRPPTQVQDEQELFPSSPTLLLRSIYTRTHTHMHTHTHTCTHTHRHCPPLSVERFLIGSISSRLPAGSDTRAELSNRTSAMICNVVSVTEKMDF